jgi:hypothetical protein
MSSCRKTIVLFDENGDNYVPYSSSTKKQWKYYRHFAAVHEMLIGGTQIVLSHIYWYAS